MPSSDDYWTVCETVYSYASGIDGRDWDQLRSIFLDEVDLDFTSYDPTRKIGPVPTDDWVRGIKPLFSGLAASQHSMSNPRVALAGDRATCKVYMQAEHVLDHGDDDAWFTIGGQYTDRLERTAAGWQIASVRLEVFWRRGRYDIMASARARGLEVLEARADQ